MGTSEALKRLGISITSTEDVKKELGDGTEKDKTIATAPLVRVKGGDKEMAVHLGLIPAAYVDAEFDETHIKDNISAQAGASVHKFKVMRFKSYIDTLNSILAQIRTNIRPDRSYLIGAPNGFGKTSFVTTAIKLMYAQGWNAVPYISLSELAEIRVENEKRILKGLELRSRRASDSEEEKVYQYSDTSEFNKKPQVITGCYSWSEYMNSDILFCYFSSLDSKIIESNTLKGILDIRGAKGLPTVVFMSTSLDPYKADYNLREYVWDEILSYTDSSNCFDRVQHISTYKKINNIIGDNDLGTNE